MDRFVGPILSSKYRTLGGSRLGVTPEQPPVLGLLGREDPERGCQFKIISSPTRSFQLKFQMGFTRNISRSGPYSTDSKLIRNVAQCGRRQLGRSIEVSHAVASGPIYSTPGRHGSAPTAGRARQEPRRTTTEQKSTRRDDDDDERSADRGGAKLTSPHPSGGPRGQGSSPVGHQPAKPCARPGSYSTVADAETPWI